MTWRPRHEQMPVLAGAFSRILRAALLAISFAAISIASGLGRALLPSFSIMAVSRPFAAISRRFLDGPVEFCFFGFMRFFLTDVGGL